MAEGFTRHLDEESTSMSEPLMNLCSSSKMQPIRDLISKVATTNTTVLLRGESGVGKEVVARAIHKASPRNGKQFLKVNCAALPGELLESELFGHEKGAFTGAYRQKPGKFEAAHQGTLLLDEIGEMPLRLQAKLLHVLQDGEFSRVGGEKIIDTDVRLIAATNRDLEASMRAHQFREDLYYRLNVIEIRIPPLRERREEIASLVDFFLRKFNAQYGRAVEIPPRTCWSCTSAAVSPGFAGAGSEPQHPAKRRSASGFLIMINYSPESVAPADSGLYRDAFRIASAWVRSPVRQRS